MLSKNSIYFKLMNKNYFKDFKYYHEFQEDSSRGHGVIVMDYNNLVIAIPLRSKLKPHLKKARHLFVYKTYSINNVEYLKALDFSKTMLIDIKYINKKNNFIFNDNSEKLFYQYNYSRLRLRLDNYIERYKLICLDINNKNL